jgi:hypothetical protein
MANLWTAAITAASRQGLLHRQKQAVCREERQIMLRQKHDSVQ